MKRISSLTLTAKTTASPWAYPNGALIRINHLVRRTIMWARWNFGIGRCAERTNKRLAAMDDIEGKQIVIVRTIINFWTVGFKGWSSPIPVWTSGCNRWSCWIPVGVFTWIPIWINGNWPVGWISWIIWGSCRPAGWVNWTSCISVFCLPRITSWIFFPVPRFSSWRLSYFLFGNLTVKIIVLERVD